MATTQSRSPRVSLAHWIAGLLAGAIAGIAPLALGTLGLALAIPVVLWAIVDRPRGVALAGALVGVGAAWLVMWARATQWCAGPNTASEGCVGPDLGATIAVPVIVLAAGGLLSFATAMRLPRRRQPPTDGPSTDGEERSR
jgi:hypothetical protein